MVRVRSVRAGTPPLHRPHTLRCGQHSTHLQVPEVSFPPGGSSPLASPPTPVSETHTPSKSSGGVQYLQDPSRLEVRTLNLRASYTSHVCTTDQFQRPCPGLAAARSLRLPLVVSLPWYRTPLEVLLSVASPTCVTAGLLQHPRPSGL
ncbi:hypothetical protein NDU88_005137 [Pleurodeles waltl]|uniref:Uncharacterized protein n=1 Tax=Pleurodeles waltl TaxID=8319 RepID=A0AAV7UIC0_PLEWA|nr:hypothetical protein NDU88_005137 [Pleurodeles waltl]